MGTQIDLAGQRFARLLVVKRIENSGKLVQWLCACDCGKETIATTKKLRNGRRKSCGCAWLPAVQAAKTKHGHAAGGGVSTELRIWMNMRARCNNIRNRAYGRYGGRGIKVCERWDAFENFLADMGPRPSPQHSIDRIDNNKGYEPSNCRWATATEQAKNTQRNKIVHFRGVDMCAADAARLSGVPYGTLLFRIRAGWGAERLFAPVK